MPIIPAVGLFCCDKFEESPNEKVVNMSKLTKSYFRGLKCIKTEANYAPYHSLSQILMQNKFFAKLSYEISEK